MITSAFYKLHFWTLLSVQGPIVAWLIRGSCLAIWSNPLTNVKWHSDPWPTVTSLPIRLSTNFMTFIIELELHWIMSGFHGAYATGVASQQGTLTLPDTWFRPPFGTCYCSNCWDQIPQTCHVFTRLFTSNTPWYFLDFAWVNLWKFPLSLFSAVVLVLNILFQSNNNLGQ